MNDPIELFIYLSIYCVGERDWRAFGGDQNGTPFDVVELAGKVASSCSYIWVR